MVVVFALDIGHSIHGDFSVSLNRWKGKVLIFSTLLRSS